MRKIGPLFALGMVSIFAATGITAGSPKPVPKPDKATYDRLPEVPSQSSPVGDFVDEPLPRLESGDAIQQTAPVPPVISSAEKVSLMEGPPNDVPLPPAPWHVFDTGSAFKVVDNMGRAVAYVYYASSSTLPGEFLSIGDASGLARVISELPRLSKPAEMKKLEPEALPPPPPTGQ